jgi:hypothetical protein
MRWQGWTRSIIIGELKNIPPLAAKKNVQLVEKIFDNIDKSGRHTALNLHQFIDRGRHSLGGADLGRDGTEACPRGALHRL